MKVLVATKEKQGFRKNDFMFAEEGELVRSGSECDGETVDGHCGCRRCMSGVKSLKSTTTVKVVDQSDMSPELLRQEVRASLERGGWLTLMDKKEADEWVESESAELQRLAGQFETGTVLEKRGDAFQVRR